MQLKKENSKKTNRYYSMTLKKKTNLQVAMIILTSAHLWSNSPSPIKEEKVSCHCYACFTAKV